MSALQNDTVFCRKLANKILDAHKRITAACQGYTVDLVVDGVCYGTLTEPLMYVRLGADRDDPDTPDTYYVTEAEALEHIEDSIVGIVLDEYANSLDGIMTVSKTAIKAAIDTAINWMADEDTGTWAAVVLWDTGKVETHMGMGVVTGREDEQHQTIYVIHGWDPCWDYETQSGFDADEWREDAIRDYVSQVLAELDWDEIAGAATEVGLTLVDKGDRK